MRIARLVAALLLMIVMAASAGVAFGARPCAAQPGHTCCTGSTGVPLAGTAAHGHPMAMRTGAADKAPMPGFSCTGNCAERPYPAAALPAAVVSVAEAGRHRLLLAMPAHTPGLPSAVAFLANPARLCTPYVRQRSESRTSASPDPVRLGLRV